MACDALNLCELEGRLLAAREGILGFSAQSLAQQYEANQLAGQAFMEQTGEAVARVIEEADRALMDSVARGLETGTETAPHRTREGIFPRRCRREF